MKPLAIARLLFTRLFRERVNIFFLFVFPLGMILIIGAAFGGAFTPKIGVVAGAAGPLQRDLVRALDRSDAFDVTDASGEEALVDQIEHGVLQGGVVIPPGYDEMLRSGSPVTIRFVARADQMELRSAVEAIVAQRSAVVRAARFTVAETGTSFDRGLAIARAAAGSLRPIGVRTRTVGKALFPTDLGRFDAGAPSELVLFVFLMSMMGGVALIESRRLGVVRRMLSTPTSTRDVILGEGLGRFAIAFMQGLVIMAGSFLLFQVDWGDPAGAVALLVAVSLVGAGAGMLIGATLRTEQQASATSLLIGLGMAALGGAMVPAELFSDTMQKVAHVTPHAWAIDGFNALVRRNGGIADVGPQLGILLGYASVLVALASWRLRKVTTR